MKWLDKLIDPLCDNDGFAYKNEKSIDEDGTYREESYFLGVRTWKVIPNAFPKRKVIDVTRRGELEKTNPKLIDY